MSIEHHKVADPQNAEIMTTTVEAHEEMAPQNVTATMAITSKGHKNMAPENAVANKMKVVATTEEHTPDNAESVPQQNDSKHKSSFRKKRDKRKEKKRKKAEKEVKAQEEQEERDRSEEEREELEYEDFQYGNMSMEAELQERINDKIQAMDRVFESEIQNPQLKRAVLDQQLDEVWAKLTTEQQKSIRGYTADIKKYKGNPFYITMNNLLRKGLYKEGGGEDKKLQNDNQDHDPATKTKQEDDYSEIEKSKQNYAAVTNCIHALKKAELPQDMVFIRETNLQALLNALNLKPSEDERDLSIPIMKNMDKYNDGSQVVFDRGFLSTGAFPSPGLRGKVEWLIQGHAGDQALFIANHSHFEHENEVLFQAGTLFRILKICPPGTGGVIYNGLQQDTWKVYMETTGADPLSGENIGYFENVW